MGLNGNDNHPVKGSKIKVEPIKKLKDVNTIKRLLNDKPRDLALFTIGINTNLRASDLLRLKVSQVRHLQPTEGENEIEVVEKKTGILLLTYQQKRAILQRFIDHSDEKSIRVFDAKTFDINLYIGLDLFDNHGDKK